MTSSNQAKGQQKVSLYCIRSLFNSAPPVRDADDGNGQSVTINICTYTQQLDLIHTGSGGTQATTSPPTTLQRSNDQANGETLLGKPADHSRAATEMNSLSRWTCM
jgi:hypothetical protein